ncbi:hypothetical protein chiPu_0009409 [Chiloscyllium punctatum]|uniref:Uncharacterized protein n=1 Tax=Chiloscyllium punctatum TaxID=137246 RepID=A0A401SKN6_CHIPU|nr:hypothetical protein [Chiloscyllium punctatum]
MVTRPTRQDLVIRGCEQARPEHVAGDGCIPGGYRIEGDDDGSRRRSRGGSVSGRKHSSPPETPGWGLSQGPL